MPPLPIPGRFRAARRMARRARLTAPASSRKSASTRAVPRTRARRPPWWRRTRWPKPAFDLGSGAAVVGGPGGVGLAGAGVGEGLLVRANADRAPAGGGGALRAQRAVGAGRREVGGAAAGAGRADRGGDPARAGDGAGAEVDAEPVLAEQAAAAVGVGSGSGRSIPAWPSRSWNDPVPSRCRRCADIGTTSIMPTRWLCRPR